MKTQYKLPVLLLSAMFLAGCSSCPCKKSVETVAPAAVPAPAPVVKQAAPVAAAAQPVADNVPAAARRYVSKYEIRCSGYFPFAKGE